MFSKLVLFDIDGTIIAHAGTIVRAVSRYDIAIKEAYGVDSVFDIQKYNGFIERSIVWDLIKDSGITHEEFLQKFSSYVEYLHKSLVELEKEGALYVTIPDAITLLAKLATIPDIALGVITGNAKRIAEWKLEKTGLAKYFSFGLYGDEADDRIELAGMVFEKAKAHFGQSFGREQIVVIGDTIHDIRAGEAIGAYTIAVTTGLHGPSAELAATEPDLLVDSLLDRKILTFFGLAEQ